MQVFPQKCTKYEVFDPPKEDPKCAQKGADFIDFSLILYRFSLKSTISLYRRSTVQPAYNTGGHNRHIQNLHSK